MICSSKAPPWKSFRTIKSRLFFIHHPSIQGHHRHFRSMKASKASRIHQFWHKSIASDKQTHFLCLNPDSGHCSNCSLTSKGNMNPSWTMLCLLLLYCHFPSVSSRWPVTPASSIVSLNAASSIDSSISQPPFGNNIPFPFFCALINKTSISPSFLYLYGIHLHKTKPRFRF